MKQLTDGAKVLHPASVDKMPKGSRFLLDDMVQAKEPFYEMVCWNPSPLMRRLGFTANPMTCPHNHKRYITRWICADCGIDCD